eukprot:TRINITY_DN37715_c0_g2_i1.p1 TRINITY_DN37715_c0_g2~~TRINITY_DN37715_c0_g2_i1.p1  ORF type:complete len:264 (-),score=23.59 TRINITY_DN37715_c0_g2_i1:228-1019(-)
MSEWETILDGQTADDSIKVAAAICEDHPESICILGNLAIGMCLSGLTGVRATIPLFLVALGSKLDPDFPLALEDGSWISTWPAIIALGVLVVVEVVCDCIPALDAMEDAVMSVVKPIFGIAVALIPFYGETSGVQIATKTFAAINAGVLSEVVALAKAANTVAVDAGTCGIGAPVRSAIEDFVTLVGTYLVIVFGAVLAVTLLLVLGTCVCCYVRYRKKRGLPLCPEPLCCRLLRFCGCLPKRKDESDSELNSGSESESEWSN